MRIVDTMSANAWLDSANYQPLLRLDRSGWAWEFLRRHPDFRRLLRAPSSNRLLRNASPVKLVTIDEDHGEALSWGLRFRGDLGGSGL